jgi:ADP-ribose pyrophosphatase YjhB (NUDIX family)
MMSAHKQLSQTHTMDVMKQLIELKKKHLKEVSQILNKVDPMKIKSDHEQFGEINESERFQLLLPMIQEGALYKPALDFIISPNFGPVVAVDVVALRLVDGVPKAILIRKMKGSSGHRFLGYATTGGHCENGETFQICGARELFEEAGVNVDPHRLHFTDTYSDPSRDPRQTMVNFQGNKVPVQRHIVSITYACTTTDEPLDSTEEAIQVVQLSLDEIRSLPKELWLTADMPLMVENAFTALQAGHIKF